MIKNLIFDLGNVLINFKPKELLLKYSNNLKKIDEFIDKIIGRDIWLDLDRGLIYFQEAKNIYLKKFPDLKELIDIFYTHWKELFSPIDQSIIILKALKNKGYNIFLLSNFIKTPFLYVEKKFDFFNIIDGRIISYEENIIKPNIKIYECLLKRFHLNPDECLFIDDQIQFLTPAKDLGFLIIHFHKSLNLRDKLKEFDIIIE